MPIGHSLLDKSDGFTLIELLVVVVLVGLIASVGLVSVGGGNQLRELQNETNRLHAVLRMAAEEAIYTNSEIGASIDSEGYEFLEYNEEDRAWEASTQTFLKTYQLPEWVSVNLEREGDKPTFSTSNKDQNDSDGGEKSSKTPDIMMLSSGEVTPFSIELQIDGDDSSSIEIKTNEEGEIVLPAVEARKREDD